MPDILIRNVPEEDVRRLDDLARRAGLSRSEFMRQRLHQVASTGRSEFTADDLRALGDRLSGLADEQLMRDAWS